MNIAIGKIKTVSPFRRLLTDFCTSPAAVIGFVVLVTLIIAALGAPIFAPQDSYDLKSLDIMDGQPVSRDHQYSAESGGAGGGSCGAVGEC